MDKDVLKSLYYYCAYQERCVQDVVKKLSLLEIEREFHQMYIEKLQEDNYLNEKRFAEAYVNGHVRKKWGKGKIKAKLQAKNIPNNLILQACKAVDEDNYISQLERLLDKKKAKYSLNKDANLRKKLFLFAKQKGFENDQINEVLNKII